MPSKLTLGLSIVTAIMNLALRGSKADWGIPVMIAVSASPALRPTWINLMLASSTTLAFLFAQVRHSGGLTKLAIVLGVVCMVAAFIGRGLKRSTRVNPAG
jgi:hypothetical protein